MKKIYYIIAVGFLIAFGAYKSFYASHRESNRVKFFKMLEDRK